MTATLSNTLSAAMFLPKLFGQLVADIIKKIDTGVQIKVDQVE